MAGEDLDRNLLLAIFDRMRAGEMMVAPDHTDQVRRVYRLLTGPLRPTNLVLPQRRLVCYCRLYEVPKFILTTYFLLILEALRMIFSLLMV